MKKIIAISPIFIMLLLNFLEAEALEKKTIPTGLPPRLRKVNIENVTVRSLAKPLATGDTTFMVRADLSETQNVTMEEVPFYKKYDGDLINVYVEVAEYDSGRVTDEGVEAIVDRMINNTPEGSINPDKGIYANEIDVVGNPPDIDNNGKLNVLLIDARDNFDPDLSSSYIAGYFDPLDQMLGKGNRAEIIYIDTNPADITSEFVHTIVAHELQHLIHYNYDKLEHDWLNEGMSVLIPKVLGFKGRNFSAFLANPNNKINKFDGSLEDYAKVGLWTYYIYNRFGIDFISEVIQSNRKSLESYRHVLSNKTDLSSIRAVMRDWFIANLLNDPTIEDGIYSYQGNPIPEMRTEHFSPSFTNNKFKEILLPSSSAQYIQFYQGQDIAFEMSHDLQDHFGLIVVKHKDEPEISFPNVETGDFELSDEAFGYDYEKISFIPYWASISDYEHEMNISYKATGIGSTREVELVHDGDSLSYYITLGGVEAAEKFVVPENTKSVSSIEFIMYKDCEATVKIYDDIFASPVKVFENVTVPGQSWKRIDLENDLLQGVDDFTISVTSEEALGYSATGTGQGQAYLKNDPNGDFQELSSFELQDGTALDGNWLIRANVNVSSPANMALTNNSLYLEHGISDTSIKITNEGTEPLYWEIDTVGLDWLSFSNIDDRLSYGTQKIDIHVDRDKLAPDLHQAIVPINSNVIDDSLRILVVERNTEQAQAAARIDTPQVTSEENIATIQLYNIGPEMSMAQYAFTNAHPALGFSPQSGQISINEQKESDTIDVKVFINHDFVNGRKLSFNFYNGVDTVQSHFQYGGTIADTSEQEFVLQLQPPFPNPFNMKVHRAANIRFILPESGKGKISIFNILGQRIKTYPMSNFTKGDNIIQWDGKNELGTYVSSGVYFVLLEFGSKSKTRKMLFLK